MACIKILMAILIIYFPVTAACYDGLRNTPKAWLDLAKHSNTPLGVYYLKYVYQLLYPHLHQAFALLFQSHQWRCNWRMGRFIRRAWLFNDPRQRSYAGGFNVCRVADISGNFTLFIFQHRLATTSFYLARLTLHDKRRQK